MRILRVAAALVLALSGAPVSMFALEPRQQPQRGGGPAAPVDVSGTWTGTWSAWDPAKPTTPPAEMCAKLSADVSKKGEVWQAIFTGDCGRPYKYTITMEGRQIGNAVMFKGTVDLGARDGGVYDWIGKAAGNDFVGFYTSPFYTGVFSLKRQ